MKYYINFAGSCEIEANDEEEAEDIFWKKVEDNEPLPSNNYEILDVGEVED
jgi:hypothetical protein